MSSEKNFSVSRLPERSYKETLYDFEKREKLIDSHVIFITKKKKVVAHAKWKDGSLIVTKVRRPNKTELKVGQALFKDDRRAVERPPRPELLTEGFQLVRSENYDSKNAIRPDPFWNEYEGWIVIPKQINGENGSDVLSKDYPELLESDDCPAFVTREIGQDDETEMKMALFSEVDAYVCGRTQAEPTLLPFHFPKQEEMVGYRGSLCYCGCGKFEGWRRYWENKWIVYVPRKTAV
jgi:hypothetical protein